MRDGVLSRNVAELIDCPTGTRRDSRALNAGQVAALLRLKLSPWWRAYIVTGACAGLRPGELLGLVWDDVDIDQGVIRVRHSLKPLRNDDGRTIRDEHGRCLLVPADLKTEQSRRTLQLEDFTDVGQALTTLHRAQSAEKLSSGGAYQDRGLIFAGPLGYGVWHKYTQRGFRGLCKAAGLGEEWTPRELRHTFVSQQSDEGRTIEQIADAVGHSNSHITQTVYRHALADTVRIVPRRPG
jgi:integrase